MKNIFLLWSSLIYSIFATNCYTSNDILNSNKLFSYKNNVYDITGYNHPGGKSDLLKTISIDASVFFNQSKYKFHEVSSKVKNDLKQLFVGQLRDNCTDFTSIKTTTITTTRTTTIPTTITESSRTKKTTKHKKPKISTEILTTIPTIIPITNIPNTTTEKQNIKNNSFSNHFLKADIKFTLVIFLVYILI